MSKTFKIISYAKNEEIFLSCLNEYPLKRSPTIQQFQVESKYRQDTSKDDFSNLSFFVKKNGVINALILCHKQNGKLTYNGRAVEILHHENNKHLLDTIFNELNQIAYDAGLKNFSISDYKFGRQLSSLGEYAYNIGGLPSCKFEAQIDLTQDKEIIHSSLRKSYKSLINQGERELEFIIINKENPDREQFEAYRSFHKKVSRRITRSVESWETQFLMIEIGCAELILGEMDSYGLVSSTFCSDHGNITFYGAGVYNRDLFDKPLGHASVYKSMMRAKDRGQGTFSMGVIHQKNTISDKEYNIGNFKKGFCSKLSCFVEWAITVNKAYNEREN